MQTRMTEGAPGPCAMDASSEDVAPFLIAHGLIDSDHPAIRAAVANVTAGCSSDQQKAVAIYRFVRDELPFGFGAAFDQYSASQVLALRRGFCNPKSTLFTAMLRAAGIPARQHMVSINMNVLTGLGPPTDVYGDHALTEVYLGGRWRLVDSYTVDAQLYKAGRAALAAHGAGAVMGYGVHAAGINDWDGASDSCVQYSGTGATATPGSGGGGGSSGSAFSGAAASADGPASDRDFGVVADLNDFRARVTGSPFAGLRGWLGWMFFGLVGAPYCNHRIAQLRAQAVGAA